MRKILTLTMRGLVTVLPLALTVYVIWWLVNTVEELLRRLLITLQVISPRMIGSRSRLVKVSTIGAPIVLIEEFSEGQI